MHAVTAPHRTPAAPQHERNTAEFGSSASLPLRRRTTAQPNLNRRMPGRCIAAASRALPYRIAAMITVWQHRTVAPRPGRTAAAPPHYHNTVDRCRIDAASPPHRRTAAALPPQPALLPHRP